MLDPDAIPSPTNSSGSSSDLDSQSTGSFFHDRSTSLGTLMGVHFRTITFRTPSQSLPSCSAPVGRGGGRKKQKHRKNKSLVLAADKGGGGRRWWSLCRDNDEAKPGSLGEFLEVERRFGDGGGFYGMDADVDVVGENGGAGVLFADGRVLPPVAQSPSTTATTVLCGICCSGRL